MTTAADGPGRRDEGLQREALPFAEATDVARKFWRVMGWQLNAAPMVTMSQHLNGGTLEERYLGGEPPLSWLLPALWRNRE